MKHLCFWILCLPQLLVCQKHDYTWVFGYDSHLGFLDKEGVVLDFNETPILITYEAIKMNIGSSNASISGNDGELLFYTNGCSIADASHEIMVNGDSINFGTVYQEQCNTITGYTAGWQSCLILPLPFDTAKFYLFHKKIVFVEEPEFHVLTDNLLYSVVDMSLNEGKGAVVEKNELILEDTLSFGEMTAVKHANGLDWWIITSKRFSNQYLIFHFSNEGVELVNEQEIGLPSTVHGGQVNFSPNGKYFARYVPQDGVFLFDFDRATGSLSNFRHIPIEDDAIVGGAIFSPSSELLYISSQLALYQYDLLESDISNSKITIDTFDGYQSPFFTTFFNGQLAPDCKIYINTFATVDVLHTIHNPNERGIACNFEQHAVQLPFNHLRSIPHYPNYSLGPLIEGEEAAPPCETLVDVGEQISTNQKLITLFPNPTSGELNVELQESLSEDAALKIYSQAGQLVRTYKLSAGQQAFQFHLQDLPVGFYFYHIGTKANNVQFTGKLVKM